ncbi:PQQ-dependent sugar dehydrogenase [Rufibacter quisquiliarum]|uniref:PQQ-dependent dehydrogenase (S-GDH family) n=1 Tax=Rufibacter quisquiliarum TaxID=1549639 RepID=A0A839GEF1_9BACT|nr:PQQ-dependent sugar dehydrogenase [Rufibacter quisquiliarum]MBA9076820.1 PQQ-dependent dehydrogenase (s-GDH family) [Rufibacter quisquiliarum]
MARSLFLLVSLFIFSCFPRATKAQQVTGPKGEVFMVRVVKAHLSDPWEVTYGPDQHLWVTEAKGYRVNRINPATGAQTVLLDLNNAKNFPRYDKIPDSLDGGKPWPQGGLMGLALHPQLLTGKPYVYLAYAYRFAGANQPGDGCDPNFGGCHFTMRVVRYDYDQKAQKLANPTILCDSIPGSNDHNSGRLLIAPMNGKHYLFYTVGDMGAGQFKNVGRPNHAQQISSYEGKVLRFNLEPDGDQGDVDRWLPNDNPFTKPGKQSAVWTYGHRNAQGLAYAKIGGVGQIYTSEHGPFSDDEINLLERGKNYGHPLIIGYNDNNYNGLAAGVSSHSHLPGEWHTTYPTITSEEANAAAIGKDTYRDPLLSLYPHSNAFLQRILEQERSGGKASPEWPSDAPSSIEVYTASAIPGWQNSLLIPTLKTGKLIRVKLNASGTAVVGDTLSYFHQSQTRYRDLALSPDGEKIYLAVDSSSVTSGPSGEDPKSNQYRGAILEFTYLRGGKSGEGATAPLPVDRKPAGTKEAVRPAKKRRIE